MGEWFTAAELAALHLPGLPATRRGIALAADAQGWTLPEDEGRSWRRRTGRGGGVEYHMSVLPLAARAKLSFQAKAEAAAPEPRAAAQAALSHADAWAWFDRLPDARKAEARSRLAALDAVGVLVLHGTARTVAMQMVAAERKIGLATLYGWDALVRDVPAEHRLPRLAPRWAGREGPRAECPPDALARLRSLWLSPSRPTVEQCIRELRKLAPGFGWTLPSDRTLRRHLEAIDRPTAIFHREGPDAVQRMFPALRRDRGTLHALQAVNADGHRFDVMVLWPDGSQARPTALVVQDIYSGKVLAWRVDKTENTDAFRLAVGDVVERFGIPDMLFIDNTLAAANKTMSGGVRRRFRFKVRDEEPLGILPNLGIEVHFTLPYSGQSKPIERAFRDFASDIAKHPAFEGAYLGNSPTAKPHNHGARAVPLAEFLQVLATGIAEHNARPGREGGVCRGRSFDQVYAESIAQVPVRRATATQRRMFLLAAESVTVRQDGTVHLLGNRYHDPELVHHIGRPLVLRFDPDALHAPVHLYRLDGGYICEAECLADTGFADTEAARAVARARAQTRKGMRLVAEAAKTIEAEQLARELRAAGAPTPEPEPDRKLVRPVFRAAGNAALKVEPEQQQSGAELLLLKALREAHGARLRPVSDDDT